MSTTTTTTKANLDITLYRGFPAKKAFSPSAFVSKLETRLRLGGVPFHVDAAGGTPMNGPRGKIPYVAVAERNAETNDVAPPTLLGDSGLIARELIDMGVLEDLNASLSAEQKARDLALRGLLEDRLYWFEYYEMWIQNWYTMRDQILFNMPYPARVMIGLYIYRMVKGNLYGQGTLRYTPDEIWTMRREVYESIEAMLVEAERKTSGGSPFWVLGRSGPTEADTTLFGFIASGLMNQAMPEGKKLIQAQPTMMKYARRVHKEYFPDYKLGA